MKMPKQQYDYKATGTPDEGNFFWGMHTEVEVWRFKAVSDKQAEKKAQDHFCYFDPEKIVVERC